MKVNKEFNNSIHGINLPAFFSAIDNLCNAFALIETVRNKAADIIDFRIKYLNKAGSRFINFKNDEITGKCISELFTGFYNSELFHSLSSAVTAKTQITIQSVTLQHISEPIYPKEFFNVEITPDNENLYLTWQEINGETLTKEKLSVKNKTKQSTGIQANENNPDISLIRKTEELERVNRELQNEITEHKHAEVIVKAERQQFFEVLETLPVYLVLLSSDYHVPFSNKFFRERFGESNGRRCYEYLFGRTEPCEVCDTYKVMETWKPRRWEWTGPDGRNYDIYDFPFTDTDGSRLIMEMGIDVTERKQAEAELENHRLHLEQLIKERTEQWENTNKQLHIEIAERKNTEEELEHLLMEVERRAAELDAVLNSMPDGLSITNSDGKLLRINASAEQILGLNLLNIGDTIEKRLHNLQIIKPDGTPFTKEETPTFRALNGEIIMNLIQVIKHKDSSTWLSVNAAPILTHDGKQIGSVTSFSDITESKRAEESLIKERSNLQALFDVVNVGMLLIDENGVVKRVNNTLSRWLGKELTLLEDFQPGDIVGCVHALTNNAGCGKSSQCSACNIRNSFEKVFHEGLPVHDVEAELSLLMDGNTANLWLDVSADPVTLDGKPYVILCINNITERKEKEVELNNLNRILLALSNSNQAMMHAEDETSFMNEVCRIITKDCGHAMVWIGFAENDQNKTVKPVAYAGFEKGYLETLNITWSDTERGRGPTGTAIRTGTISMCRNVLTDQNFKPWRKEAIKRGYASSIVLPLRDGNKVFGAITIYSGKPDSFSDREVELLSELSNDLAYGIIALRLREIHKRAEEELKKSEEQYRTLFNGMTEGFAIHEIITDEAGNPYDYRFLDINPAFERLTGLKRQNVLGRTYNQVFPNENNERLKNYARVALTGEPMHFESFSPTINKHFNIYSYRNAPGQFVLIFMDITIRKQAEKALKISQSRAELLAKTAGRLLASNDPQHLVEELCREVMEFLDCHVFFNFLVDESAGCLHLNAYAGVPVEEADKIRWLNYGTAVCGCVAQTCKRIIAEEIPTTPDIRTDLVKSYGVKAYACHPLMNQSTLIGTLSFGTRSRTRFSEEDIELMRAITDLVAIAMNRISTEHALQESEIRFKQLADAMPQLVWTANPDGTVDYYNQRVNELSGVSQDDRGNWTWLPVIIAEDSKLTSEAWSKSISSGTIYDVTHRLKMITGENRWFLSRGIPIKNSNNEIVKWFGTSTDIDEQKVNEEKLIQTLADLESSNRDLEQFAYIASHDLQEPIRMIKSYSQLLERKFKSKLDSDADEYLGFISDGASRMHQLVSDLLKYSRITTKVLPSDAVNCNIIVSEVLEDLKVIINEANAYLDIDPLPVVQGDKTQIRQLFQNFIQNAIKFRNDIRPEIKISCKKQDSFWLFSIKDNGIGIKSEYFEKIFVIFQRLHEKEKYPGTGIGLALCKKIIERHGGEIYVESEIGKGTTFYFTLPA